MIDAKDMQSPKQAAQNFRAILDAFAKPGRLARLPAVSDCPPGLHAAAAGIALALCDYQASIWLSASVDSAELRHFLRFHTGVPIAGKPSEASFALVDSREFGQLFPHFSKGTHEYPDRSTTVIVQTTGFDDPQRVELEGPGIRNVTTLAIAGLGPSEWKMLADDRIVFPLGVDVAFTAGEELVALPRSTRIAALENR